MLEMLSDKGCLRMLFLQCDDKAVAGHFLFDYNGTRYSHKPGYNLTFKDHSPGTLLLWETIKDAIDSKLKTYDFLRGKEAYKYFFANDELHCSQVVAANNMVSMKMFRAFPSGS
jgi:CelD/BcsL family acetyltransferase involved in cellulose biosynthesis